MMVRFLDRNIGNSVVGAFRISDPLPKWLMPALAFMAPWRFNAFLGSEEIHLKTA